MSPYSLHADGAFFGRLYRRERIPRGTLMRFTIPNMSMNVGGVGIIVGFGDDYGEEGRNCNRDD